MVERVTVLGGGSFGTATAYLLGQAGHAVLLWLRNPDSANEINTHGSNSRYFANAALPKNVRATTDLAAAAAHSKTIFATVPSKAFRQLMRDTAPHLSAEHMIVHGTKGIERGSFKTMSELIREETCVRRIGCIAGPNLAQEIIDGKPAATVVGSKFDEVVQRVRALLTTQSFLVYGNRDLRGVELGGTLKNVLAIGAGIIDGADFGTNAKSLLVTRGLAELMRFGVAMGAEPSTFGGLSGIGDIIATCTSPLSRNYQVGFRLGQGESIDAIRGTLQQVAEGVDTTAVLYDYAERHGLRINLTAGLYHLLFRGASVSEVRKMVMHASAVYEVETAQP